MLRLGGPLHSIGSYPGSGPRAKTQRKVSFRTYGELTDAGLKRASSPCLVDLLADSILASGFGIIVELADICTHAFCLDVGAGYFLGLRVEPE